MTIFDHIKNLTIRKKYCTDEELKTFDVYMINRWLSMHPDLTEMINELQKINTSALDKKQIYRLYLAFLPKQSFFIKYIKSSGTEKYNSELINIMSKYYKTSKFKTIYYLDILYYLDPQLTEIKDILQLHGIIEKKEVDKLIKLSK